MALGLPNPTLAHHIPLPEIEILRELDMWSEVKSSRQLRSQGDRAGLCVRGEDTSVGGKAGESSAIGEAG